MTTKIDLQNEIASLPPNLQKEVWDFVQFVKKRHGLPSAQTEASPGAAPADSQLYQALEEIGFVGCIESDEQLSQTYKSRMDFSNKCGEKP
jgi:hypothetical protein